MPDPQLIQIKKYPNRRLYDQTRSRHLTHEELYDLVVAGHTVSVTDSKSGTDITNLVLAQALIERSPEKFATFPPELLHLMIRASEQMLRGFATTWFTQMMKGMGAAPFTPAAAAWPQTPMWPFAAPVSPPPSQPTPDPVADLQQRMAAMLWEIEELKRRGTAQDRQSGK